jgi:hypothetical protein
MSIFEPFCPVTRNYSLQAHFCAAEFRAGRLILNQCYAKLNAIRLQEQHLLFG